MKKRGARDIVTAGLIAAIYAALTLSLPVFSYGMVQIRFAEALTILPVFSAAAIPGLTIGCFFANIFGPYTYIDAIFGTSATLIAAIMTRQLRKIRFKNFPFLSVLPPVIFNAIFIGLEISIFFADEAFSFYAFLITALWVGLGEAIACFFISPFLYFGIQKTELKRYFKE